MVDSAVNGSFWKNLTEGEGAFRMPRALLFLLFLGGAVFSGWCFKMVADLSVEEAVFVDPPPSQSRLDEERLDGIIEAFRGTVEARQGSSGVVASVTDKNRRPFEVSRRAGKSAAGGAQVEAPLVEPIVEELLPPIMFVRAIMVVGNEAIAIMDINGVGNGVIVKTGYMFLDKKGRIAKITPEKVTVRWAGKNIDITPGF